MDKMNQIKMKRCRWRAWDSNSRPQEWMAQTNPLSYGAPLRRNKR